MKRTPRITKREHVARAVVRKTCPRCRHSFGTVRHRGLCGNCWMEITSPPVKKTVFGE